MNQVEGGLTEGTRRILLLSLKLIEVRTKRVSRNGKRDSRRPPYPSYHCDASSARRL